MVFLRRIELVFFISKQNLDQFDRFRIAHEQRDAVIFFLVPLHLNAVLAY